MSDDGARRRTARQMTEFSERLAKGTATLAGFRADPEPGATPRREVHRIGGARLLRFEGPATDAGGAPLLIVYALVNRPYMLDLEPDRSFVRGLLDRGREVYLVDWGYPGKDDSGIGLDDYVNRYVQGFVEHLRARTGTKAVDLVGVCQGGTLSLCYAAIAPSRVRRLALMVTPVDFGAEEFLLSRWLRYVDVDALVDSLGNVPGSLLNWAFLALKPLSLSGLKALDLLELMDRPEELATFARMEHWLQDNPDQAGTAFREFAHAFFRDNRLVTGGLRIGRHTVSLDEVRMPVLNVYAERDHIVPPAASRRLRSLLAHDDYTEHAFDGGHIGVFASRRARSEIPDLVCDWFSQPR